MKQQQRKVWRTCACICFTTLIGAEAYTNQEERIMNAANEIISLTDSIHSYLSQLDSKLNDSMKPSITAFPFDTEHWSEVERIGNRINQQVVNQFVNRLLDTSDILRAF